MATLPLTAVKAKIWLIFANSRVTLLARLSKNMLREICTYLQDLVYPCINDNILALYDLNTGPAATIPLSHTFKAVLSSVYISQMLSCVSGRFQLLVKCLIFRFFQAH